MKQIITYQVTTRNYFPNKRMKAEVIDISKVSHFPIVKSKIKLDNKIFFKNDCLSFSSLRRYCFKRIIPILKNAFLPSHLKSHVLHISFHSIKNIQIFNSK